MSKGWEEFSERVLAVFVGMGRIGADTLVYSLGSVGDRGFGAGK